ncbi:MAG: GFA family protein [Pseudolabrys sp.]
MISNQARFRREQVTFAGKATAWMRTAESGNALTFHFCPTCGSSVYWEGEGFLGTSPLPLATSPTRISPRRPSQCGRSHAIPGSPCRPIHHPSAWRNRGDKKPADVHFSLNDVRFAPESGH